MDHIYDIFNDIEPTLTPEEVLKETSTAQMLSAIDYITEEDYDNAIEVLIDINEEKEE